MMLTVTSDYENVHLNNHVIPFQTHPISKHEEKSDNTRLWQAYGEVATLGLFWD